MSLNKFQQISTNFKKKQKAFTLVEVLISISILVVGILSGFILVTRALYNTAVIQDRLTASFLAQEGIELVRQVRDSNLLQIMNGESVEWKDRLEDGSYTIESKAGSEQFVTLIRVNPGEANDFYYHDDTKIYNYAPGDSTTFNREIKITIINDDEIRVESIMKWETRTIDFTLTVEDHLFNWLKF